MCKHDVGVLKRSGSQTLPYLEIHSGQHVSAFETYAGVTVEDLVKAQRCDHTGFQIPPQEWLEPRRAASKKRTCRPNTIEGFVIELVAFFEAWRPLVKQPGEEQLGMRVTLDKLTTATDREFSPGLLDRLSSVRLPNEPHYRDGVAVDCLTNAPRYSFLPTIVGVQARDGVLPPGLDDQLRQTSALDSEYGTAVMLEACVNTQLPVKMADFCKQNAPPPGVSWA